MSEHYLDATGLICPMPVLRARKALKGMVIGDVLVVEATDAAALKDFPAFCATTGHRLLGAETDGGVHRFRIQKTV